MSDEDEEEVDPYQPLTSAEEHRVLIAAAAATAVVGVVTLIVEIATGSWLAEAVGLSFFVSAPLGVGMVVLTLVLARAGGKHALFPAVCSIVYWTLFFVFI